MERFEKANEYNRVSGEMDRITNTIIQVFSQGENASLVIDVEFPESIEYVKLGDRLEMSGSVFWRSLGLYYKFIDGAEIRVPMESGTRSVPVSNSTGRGSLEFGSGRSRLQFVKVYSDALDDFFISAAYLEV